VSSELGVMSSENKITKHVVEAAIEEGEEKAIKIIKQCL
jgi:hypothetical protein